MNKIFWTHTIILTILVMIWELLYFKLDLISLLNITGTEIRIFGLVSFIMTITINILSIKKLFKNNITKSILKLTYLGTVTTLIPFLSLQILRIIMDKNNNESIDYYYMFIQILTLTIFSLVLSFLISFEVTTKRTGMTLLFIVLTLIIFALIKGIIKI